MFTLSPGDTKTSFITPEFSAGISIDALSDSKTSSVSSTDTSSPMETVTSLTSAPSIPSPRSGSKIFFIILPSYTVIGLGFSESKLYFFITFSTTFISTLLSLARALITVRTI